MMIRIDLSGLDRDELAALSAAIDTRLAEIEAGPAATHYAEQLAMVPSRTRFEARRRDWTAAEDLALMRAWLAGAGITEAAAEIGVPRGHAVRRWQHLACGLDGPTLRRSAAAVIAALTARAEGAA